MIKAGASQAVSHRESARCSMLGSSWIMENKQLCSSLLTSLHCNTSKYTKDPRARLRVLLWDSHLRAALVPLMAYSPRYEGAAHPRGGQPSGGRGLRPAQPLHAAANMGLLPLRCGRN